MGTLKAVAKNSWFHIVYGPKRIDDNIPWRENKIFINDDNSYFID